MIARGYEWSVVRRYLSGGKRDLVISVTAIMSVVAIALGVTAGIVVMSVMNGFRADLMEGVLGYHGHVLIQGFNGKIEGYQAIVDDVKDIDGVVKVMPFSESQVMLTKDGQAWGAIVRGLPDNFLNEENLNIARVVAGRIEDASKIDGIVLGAQLATRLRVTVGDTVTVVSPNSVSTPFGSALRYLSYPVAAVVEIGVIQFDDSFIGMPLEEAQRFFRLGNTVTNIEMMLTSPELVDQLGPVIKQKVAGRAYVRTWRSLNQGLVGMLQTERVVMFLIMAIIILVAAFNISSSLFMLVKDKAPDIAILRTMGATSGAIRRVFVTIGLLVGLFGVVLGCIWSWLITANIVAIKSFVEWLFDYDVWDPTIRFVSNIRADVNLLEAGLTIGIAVLLSLIAALLPARRAARLDPVEVLRYE